MKSKKATSLPINTVLILGICIIVAVIFFFAIFGMPKPLEAIWGEDKPLGYDEGNMNIMETKPKVTVASGWECSTEVLELDENEEYWINITFDWAISEEGLEGKYTVYRDNTLGWAASWCPSVEDQWIDYELLEDGYEKGIYWPNIEYELADEGKTVRFGPFPRKNPEKRDGNGFYYIIRFDTDGKNAEESLTSKGGKILNPRMKAVKFQTP